MPNKIIEYECVYCGWCVSNLSGCEGHESICYFNPNLKGCETCKFNGENLSYKEIKSAPICPFAIKKGLSQIRPMIENCKDWIKRD